MCRHSLRNSLRCWIFLVALAPTNLDTFCDRLADRAQRNCNSSLIFPQKLADNYFTSYRRLPISGMLIGRVSGGTFLAPAWASTALQTSAWLMKLSAYFLVFCVFFSREVSSPYSVQYTKKRQQKTHSLHGRHQRVSSKRFSRLCMSFCLIIQCQFKTLFAEAHLPNSIVCIRFGNSQHLWRGFCWSCLHSASR